MPTRQLSKLESSVKSPEKNRLGLEPKAPSPGAYVRLIENCWPCQTNLPGKLSKAQIQNLRPSNTCPTAKRLLRQRENHHQPQGNGRKWLWKQFFQHWRKQTNLSGTYASNISVAICQKLLSLICLCQMGASFGKTRMI